MADRTRSMVAVCPVTRTREDRQRQLQVERDGQPLDDVGHAEPFGLTSRPNAGAEAVVVAVAGRSDEPVAVVVADRRGRPQDLAAGDVTLWDAHGHRIDLSSTGVGVAGAVTVDSNVDAASYSAGGTAGITGTYTDGVTGFQIIVKNGLVVGATGVPAP